MRSLFLTLLSLPATLLRPARGRRSPIRVARRRRADERRAGAARCRRPRPGRGKRAPRVDRPGRLVPGRPRGRLLHAPRGRARPHARRAAAVSVGAGETRLDLVLAPAPVRERVVVSATRGEATLSSLGVAVGRARPRADRRARGGVALQLLQDVPGVATARTGQTGQQGSVFVRGGESRFARVLVDGVRGEPAGRRVRLRQRAAVRARAGRGGARRGEQPLRHRRARRRREPRDAPGAGGASVRRCAPRARAAASTGSAASARPRERTASFDWNAGVQRPGRPTTRRPTAPSSDTAAALSAGRARSARAATSGSWPATRRQPRGRRARRPTAGPTSTLPRARRPACSRRAAAPRRRRRLAAARRRLRAHRPALAEPASTPAASCRSGRGHRRLSELRLPESRGLPEPDRPAGRSVPGRFRGRIASPADGGRRARARDGRARQPLGGAAAALAHELRRLPAGPSAARPPRLPDARRARREERKLRDQRGAARRARGAPRGTAPTRRRSARAPGVGVKEPSFFESYGESFFAKGNPDLDPERSTTFDVGVEQRACAAGCAPRRPTSTTTTTTRSPTRSWTSTHSRART